MLWQNDAAWHRKICCTTGMDAYVHAYACTHVGVFPANAQPRWSSKRHPRMRQSTRMRHTDSRADAREYEVNIFNPYN